MRKQILDALKAKFQGVSESILNRIADKLCKTVTTAEQVQTAVDGVTIQQVIESYADSRATEASQTAVHTYEQKYGLKDGAKVEQPSGAAAQVRAAHPFKHHKEGVQTPCCFKLFKHFKRATESCLSVLTRWTASVQPQHANSNFRALSQSCLRASERLTSVHPLTT